MQFDFDIRDQATAHDDIVVRFGGHDLSCDSYYLRLDKSVDPDDESAGKSRRVLARMLNLLLARLAGLADGESTLFPFGFDDESTRWFRCSVQGDRVNCRPGWSAREGWAFRPCEFEEVANTIDDFQPLPDCEAVTFYRPRLLSLIRQNIHRLVDVSQLSLE